jgi:hypothetical protein
MANLIKKDESVEKALKIELPDGTEGEIPIQDATERGQIISGDMVYKEGGEVKKYIEGGPTTEKSERRKLHPTGRELEKGGEVRKGWVKDYEDRFKTKEELEAEKRKKAPMQKTAKRMKRARKKHKRK